VHLTIGTQLEKNSGAAPPLRVLEYLNMIMTTVVAVALGFAPVKDNGPAQVVSGDYTNIVGRYSETVDRKGITHLTGFNRLSGAPYDLTVDADGKVEGTVGDSYVTFTVSEAS